MPLFTIITVTYNASEAIMSTLESVRAQTFTDYEHLIIDGASTDDTLRKAETYARPQLKVDSRPDGGIYDAMNRGLKLATGDYVIFMNAGDTFHTPVTLETLATATADRPGIVYGQTLIVSGKERTPVGPRHLTAPRQLDAKSFRNGMLVCHQAMAIRRDLAPEYDLRYRLSADFDWTIRCLQKSDKNVYVDQYVADYLDEGATTRNHRKSLIERYKIMCHYYGTVPTLARHVKFALRNAIRKLRHQ